MKNLGLIMLAATGLLANKPAPAAPTQPPQIRAATPPSLKVSVTAGTVAGADGRPVAVQPVELTFAPPEVGEATSKGPIPGNYNPDRPLEEQMRGWNAFCPLPPEKPEILGFFFRGIPAESFVLKSHDGAKTFERGGDHFFSSEMGQALAIKNRLGKPPADRKKPKPEEQLLAEFKYYKQRLDLVQVDGAGRVSVKKGESVIMCPPLPAPDAGCVGLAGVWVYGAHGQGPVPASPDGVAIAQADICAIRPLPPVAPVNAKALSKVVSRLKAGKPVGVGFFGDSIAVGAEAPDWYFHTYSPRNKGFVGMVLRGLRERYPEADVQPAWSIAGAQSIFNEKMWQNVLKRAASPGRPAPSAGEYVWWEAEPAAPAAAMAAPATSARVEEFVLQNDGEKRVLSKGAWRALAGGEGAEYAVDVPSAEGLRLFVRRANNRGQMRWQWDGGAWETQDESQKPTDADDVRHGLAVCWFDLGAVNLAPGKHTLRVEAVGAPVALDCFALTAGELGPWRTYCPGGLGMDVVIYAMGMNGGFNEKTPREMHKETILRHISEARQRGAEVLLVATMENNARLLNDPGKSKKPNRDLMAEIAAETGCPFADVYTEWMNQESRGVPPEARLHNFINHPGEEGHRLWADVILRLFDAAKE